MKFLLIIFIALISLSIKAQDSNFNENDFESIAIFNEAIQTIDKGDAFFFAGNFKKALPYYTKIQALNSENALLNFKIGVCHYKLRHLSRALPYFEAAKLLNPYVDPKIDFALAQSYQDAQEYTKAINAYQNYLSQLSKSKKASETPKVQKEIDLCLKKQNTAPSQKELAKQDNQKQKTQSHPQTITKQKVQKPENKKPSVTKGIHYKIQIAASPTMATKNDLKQKYSGELEITQKRINGWYKYFIGDFKTQKEALKAKEQSGVVDAFIVKFKDGEKL